jgi:hypothetical protein
MMPDIDYINAFSIGINISPKFISSTRQSRRSDQTFLGEHT